LLAAQANRNCLQVSGPKEKHETTERSHGTKEERRQKTMSTQEQIKLQAEAILRHAYLELGDAEVRSWLCFVYGRMQDKMNDSDLAAFRKELTRIKHGAIPQKELDIA